jgi:hypothetical protein
MIFCILLLFLFFGFLYSDGAAYEAHLGEDVNGHYL